MTHVLIKDAMYYRDGPQQARPPDGTLATGTLIELIREEEVIVSFGRDSV
jgi:hypothetical protein